MDLISVCGGSPAGRQPAIRGISSSHKACKHTHTHTHTHKRTHIHTSDPHIELARMESIISGHKRTVFLVTQLPGCSLCSPAPSQLHFQPCCSCSCSLLPFLFLSNFSFCIWLTLSASSSPPLSLPLLLIVPHYHSLPICWG